MNNILNEYIEADFKGRLLFTVRNIKDKDVRDKTVLDVGCGFGWIIAEVLRRGVRKAVGIEISEKDLETAKRNIQDKRAEFNVGSSSAIPYPDGHFDTVFSFEVLEHVPVRTENRFFREVHRVLKKGGVFYLSTPYDAFLSKTMDPAWWLIHHRHYSKEQLRGYAEKNGFTVSELQTRGGIWDLVNALNMYASKWLLRRGPVFADFFNRRENAEFRKKSGIATVFLKATKI